MPFYLPDNGKAMDQMPSVRRNRTCFDYLRLLFIHFFIGIFLLTVFFKIRLLFRLQFFLFHFILSFPACFCC